LCRNPCNMVKNLSSLRLIQSSVSVNTIALYVHTNYKLMISGVSEMSRKWRPAQLLNPFCRENLLQRFSSFFQAFTCIWNPKHDKGWASPGTGSYQKAWGKFATNLRNSERGFEQLGFTYSSGRSFRSPPLSLPLTGREISGSDA
jgi:hypothetical protein